MCKALLSLPKTLRYLISVQNPKTWHLEVGISVSDIIKLLPNVGSKSVSEFRTFELIHAGWDISKNKGAIAPLDQHAERPLHIDPC